MARAPIPKYEIFDVIEALHDWMENGERPDAMGLHEYLNERFVLGWGGYEGDLEDFAGVLKSFVNTHVC